MRFNKILLLLVVTILLVASPLHARPGGKGKPQQPQPQQPSSTDVAVQDPSNESMVERFEHFLVAGLGWFAPKVIGSVVSTGAQFLAEAGLESLGLDPTSAYYASMGLSLGVYKIVNHAGEVAYQMLVNKPEDKTVEPPVAPEPHPTAPQQPDQPQPQHPGKRRRRRRRKSPISKKQLPTVDPGHAVLPGERILIPTSAPSDKDVKEVAPTEGFNKAPTSCEKKFVESIGYVWPALCPLAGLLAQVATSNVVHSILTQGVTLAEKAFSTSVVADALATLANAGATELVNFIGDKIEHNRASSNPVTPQPEQKKAKAKAKAKN